VQEALTALRSDVSRAGTWSISLSVRPSRRYRNLLLEEVFSKVGLRLDPRGRVIGDLVGAPLDSEIRGASLLSKFGPIDFAQRVTILNANVISWGKYVLWAEVYCDFCILW
jgi:hypothetical protein